MLYFDFISQKKGFSYGVKSGAYAQRITQTPLFEKSLFFSVIFFILFTLITLSVIKANNSLEQNEIAKRTGQFSNRYFHQLTDTMRRVGLLTTETCASVASEINRDAVFSIGVRDFQLVRDGMVYCSSASGNQHVPANSTLHGIDFTKPMAVSLQMGTPAVPNRPVIIVWQRNAGSFDDGVIATLELTLSPYMLFA